MANEFQNLAERLRWLRQNQDPYMTQEQLAHASGVSVHFIRMYETGGQMHMSTETIQKLAAALKCKFTIRLKRLSSKETMEFPAPKITKQAKVKAKYRDISPWTDFKQRKQGLTN